MRELLLLISAILAQQKRPNVIVILADDLGFNDMPWNNPSIIAPNLAKLAKSGTIISDMYVQPVCTPSRSALMTSRYPIRLGLQTSVITAPQPSCLPLDEVTLADEMKSAGYRTHIVGKWHLGHYCPQCLPQQRGFDTFYGYLTGAEDYYKKTFCIPLQPGGQAACGYDFYNATDVDYSANGTYSTYLYRDAVKALITDHQQNHQDAPFFLYLPFQSVHYPVEVPANYSDLYPNEKDHTRRTYMGMVTALDEAVGGIVSHLDAMKMAEDTVIYYTTDNGGLVGAGGRNAPFRGQKATLWQGGLRVPAFVTGKNVKKGETYSGLMHITDIQMTILDMINHKRTGTKPVDGVSHWNHFQSRAQQDGRSKEERSFYLERLQVGQAVRDEILLNIDHDYVRFNPLPNLAPYPNPYFNTTVHSAIISRSNGITWKFLTGDPGCDGFDQSWQDCKKQVLPDPYPSVWLFNLDHDPTETSNLAAHYPSLVETFLKKLAVYDANSYPTFYPPRDPAADPKLHNGTWGPWQDKPNDWPRSLTSADVENDVILH